MDGDAAGGSGTAPDDGGSAPAGGHTEGVETEELSFPGSTGARLSGVLHLPPSPHGSVLMVHCFTCSKDLHTMTRLARGLAEAGYAALRFDFTGLGASGGAFRETTISNDVRDVVAAATALVQRDLGPCGLLGHSLGGAAGLLAAQRLRTVRSVAVLGAPATPSHVERLLSGQEEQIRREGEAVVEIAGRPFPVRASFLDDLGRFDEEEEIATLDRPLLVLHAVDDEVVEVTQGERIFATARQPKAFMPLMDADHLLTRPAAARRALAVLTEWFDHSL